MKRFRVHDKWLHETLEQSDTNDYSYRDKEFRATFKEEQ